MNVDMIRARVCHAEKDRIKTFSVYRFPVNAYNEPLFEPEPSEDPDAEPEPIVPEKIADLSGFTFYKSNGIVISNVLYDTPGKLVAGNVAYHFNAVLQPKAVFPAIAEGDILVEGTTMQRIVAIKNNCDVTYTFTLEKAGEWTYGQDVQA